MPTRRCGRLRSWRCRTSGSGERACAFVVLEPGGQFDFATMQRHLDRGRLSKTYWPERFEIVDSLPHTPSGKIQKFVLREHISELVRR